MTNIIIDDRETASRVADALRKTSGVSVTVQRLTTGDYQIDQKLLVERKTFNDLANSVKDGRLFQQACRLASNPMRTAMILEGTADDLNRIRMRREAILGALVTIAVVFGIPLLRSRDPQESARLLLYAARQIQSIPSRALPRRGKRPRGKHRIQLYLLQGLPGIGPERARRLLETFGCVEAVVRASTDQLAAVSGIGFKIAHSIRWSVSPQ